MKRESLKTIGMFALAGAIYWSPMMTAIWMNSKFEDIGEGYKVREIGNQRQFYIGAEMGLARLAIDENKDGTLDRTLRNMPITPYMGGPGYRLMRTETTAQDSMKFERANHLYESNRRITGEGNE